MLIVGLYAGLRRREGSVIARSYARLGALNPDGESTDHESPNRPRVPALRNSLQSSTYRLYTAVSPLIVG